MRDMSGFFVCLQVMYIVPVLVCYYGHWCGYVYKWYICISVCVSHLPQGASLTHFSSLTLSSTAGMFILIPVSLLSPSFSIPSSFLPLSSLSSLSSSTYI